MIIEPGPADDAELPAIDGAADVIGWARCLPFIEFKREACALAKTADIVKMHYDFQLQRGTVVFRHPTTDAGRDPA